MKLKILVSASTSLYLLSAPAMAVTGDWHKVIIEGEGIPHVTPLLEPMTPEDYRTTMKKVSDLATERDALKAFDIDTKNGKYVLEDNLEKWLELLKQHQGIETQINDLLCQIPSDGQIGLNSSIAEFQRADSRLKKVNEKIEEVQKLLDQKKKTQPSS